MTREQLEKEAEEKGREWERSVLPKCEEDYVPYAPHYPYSKGYIAAAEPREKRIAELEEKIEKMMCCSNCKNCRRKFIKKNVFEHTCKVEHCKNYDKWEIKEND